MLGLPPVRLFPPTAATFERARLHRLDTRLTYAAVGATRTGTVPAGFAFDEHGIALGPGTFDRAAAAVRGWAMFDAPWLRLPDRPTPEVGRTFVFASHQLGVWTLNVCRIVYVVDTPTESGFAYGTLRPHALAGEERFVVRLDPQTDEVTFSVQKFSRIAAPALWLIAPYVRALQRRFSRDACASVRRAVERR